MPVKILVNSFLERSDRSMRTSPELVLGEAGKKAFHEVQPRAIRGRKVALKSGVAKQPVLHRLCLMSSVIVQNQMHLQLLRNLTIYVAQEADEIDATMAPFYLANDLPGGHVKRSK